MISGIFTVAALSGFLAVVVWVIFSGREKFDRAARTPLDDDNDQTPHRNPES